MPTIRDLPSIDLTKFEFPKIDFSKVELPTIDFSKVELPAIDVPKVDLPDLDRVLAVARDAAYIGIGMTVLGVNEAQVRRRAAQARLAEAQHRIVDTVRETVARRNG
jgi:hypothetical protein